MPINTISVAAAVTPTVIHTYLSHYLKRKPLRQKPTAHISYHEGLELIRSFLHYASLHTVQDIQAFTSQWVPVPTWVHVEEVQIPETCLAKSATHIQAQLGPEGIEQVGGRTWWQWRRDDGPLRAEWIEMRKDLSERTKTGNSNPKGQRIMLYVHGGAYFFGSVDEHRYQMQRHARKLKARVLAPRYRLAPQFPFPCGLMDCLAAYLYLLESGHPPSTILLAGDSAGAGMVLSVLVTLRDQGVPLPAGAILISPWVDLTHSFPSLGGDGKLDYIPAHGFVHKPSLDWPPPNADDLLWLEQHSKRGTVPTKSPRTSSGNREGDKIRVRGFSVKSSDRPHPDGVVEQSKDSAKQGPRFVAEDGKYTIGPSSTLSVYLDDKLVEIKDQIQMYAPNHLLMHPLVSPALQPTLGGLPPLLIQVGGGELLRDEQIYIAHKAASPRSYLPRPSLHVSKERIQSEAAKYGPTNVQLQVWDDLCHVAPTLSFTRPAKYMYRSIAQFGAWALARAQKTSIDILDDDDVSIISTASSSSSSLSSSTDGNDTLSPDEVKLNMPNGAQNVVFESVAKKQNKGPAVGKAGDPLPAFTNHMIRQRIDRHGTIHELSPASELPALNLPVSEIGIPKRGPLNKWMSAQASWNQKFAKEKIKVQKQRIRDMQMGYEGFDNEIPPPTALAGRRLKGVEKEKRKKKSWGMALWSLWGSKHDEKTIIREGEADANPVSEAPTKENEHDHARPTRSKTSKLGKPENMQSRSRSRHSAVTDKGQTTDIALADADADADTTQVAPPPNTGLAEAPDANPAAEEPEPRPTSPPTLIPASNTLSTRPTRDGVAYPFRLKVDEGDMGANASMITLNGDNDEEHQRPVVERCVTADVGDLKFGAKGTEEEEGKRPVVERFETAKEAL